MKSGKRSGGFFKGLKRDVKKVQTKISQISTKPKTTKKNREKRSNILTSNSQYQLDNQKRIREKFEYKPRKSTKPKTTKKTGKKRSTKSGSNRKRPSPTARGPDPDWLA